MKNTWGMLGGGMFGRRVDQKKRAFEAKLKGSAEIEEEFEVLIIGM